MTSKTTKNKIFFAEAVKGYTLKVMIDTLSMPLKRAPFIVNKKGFYHRSIDDNNNILFDIEFDRSNFKPYHCSREVAFDLNIKHLQKMVKNVKKKDSIILFIEKKRPDVLGVTICPSGSISNYKQRIETVYITINKNIQQEKQEALELPETYIDKDGKEKSVYGYPMVINSIDFQKIKKITGIGKSIKIEMQRNNYISFYSDNGQLYSSKIEFGEIVDNPESEAEKSNESEDEEDEKYSEEEEVGTYSEEEKEDSEDKAEKSDDSKEEEIIGWYEAEFHMSIFTHLMKLPGLCSQMQFFAPKMERFPLKIKMKAGDLGTITVYIKDKALVDYQNAKRQSSVTTKK